MFMCILHDVSLRGLFIHSFSYSHCRKKIVLKFESASYGGDCGIR